MGRSNINFRSLKIRLSCRWHRTCHCVVQKSPNRLVFLSSEFFFTEKERNVYCFLDFPLTKSPVSRGKEFWKHKGNNRALLAVTCCRLFTLQLYLFRNAKNTRRILSLLYRNMEERKLIFARKLKIRKLESESLSYHRLPPSLYRRIIRTVLYATFYASLQKYARHAANYNF